MSEAETAIPAPAPENSGLRMRKMIWRTFRILLLITAFEVGIAFSSLPPGLLKLIFIGLTIVKAYYIVFMFMHLKHERPHFAWVILLPFILVLYLIYIMLYEGSALQDIRTAVAKMI